MDANSTNCPLCMSADVAAFSAIPHDVPQGNVRLSLKECLDCGLAWQFPRYRTVEQSVERHSNVYEAQKEGSYYDPEKRRAVAVVELDFVESFFGAPATLLDVGAGDGAFIAHAASRGWKCIGVDPSARQDPRLAVSGSGAFELVHGTLSDLDSDQKFDAITMWDVIEHLDDPEEVLRAAAPLLKDSGVFVVETGNFQSVERIMSGPNWWAYAADHRWYFTPPSIAQLLRRVGLEHCVMAKTVLRPGWRGSHSYNVPSLSRRLKRLVRNPLLLMKTVEQSKLLTVAGRDWMEWGGLGIFTIAASRHPVRPCKEGVGLSL